MMISSTYRDGLGEDFVEAREGAEDVGHREIQHGVELAQVVLDRRAAKQTACYGPDGSRTTF
jgi:hypothetical protein